MKAKKNGLYSLDENPKFAKSTATATDSNVYENLSLRQEAEQLQTARQQFLPVWQGEALLRHARRQRTVRMRQGAEELQDTRGAGSVSMWKRKARMQTA